VFMNLQKERQLREEEVSTCTAPPPRRAAAPPCHACLWPAVEPPTAPNRWRPTDGAQLTALN
jgi:hypothetical protein